MKRSFLRACLLGSFCLYAGLGLTPAVQAALPADAEAQRTEAVRLARANQYEPALAIFRQLAAAGDEDTGFWADYLTVLSWDGKTADMTQLAEQHFGSDFSPLPDYALSALAQAYSQQGLLQKADSVYQLLAKRGNDEGQARKAADLASQQAVDAMNRKDYVEGERYFAKAKQLAPASAKNYARDIDARRAAIYVQQGEAGRAVRILTPYVADKTATPHMFSDYLLALRFDNQAKRAEKDFSAYGKDWSDLPSYGLQTMGDIYLRSRQYAKAHDIYHYLNQRGPQAYVRLGDAYALMQLGREKEALAEYQAVLNENQYSTKLENLIAGDGTALLQQGRLHEGRQVYALLGRDKAEKETYRLAYGQALVRVNSDLYDPLRNFQRDVLLDGRDYYYEAARVLKPLQKSADPEIRLQAKALMANNVLNQGRFASSDKAVAALLAEDNDHPAVLDVSAKNDARQEHDLGLSYGNHVDNKRNHESSLGLDYSQYLGANLYASAGAAHYRLQDGRLHSSYNQDYAGLRWLYGRGSLGLNYDYFGSDWKNGYDASFSYDVNDLSSLSFAVGRRPHDAAGAVAHRITEDYASVEWDFIPHPRWRLGLSYERADLSDDNQYWQAALSGRYALSQRHNYFDALPFTISRSHYDDTSDIYDSPYRSINYGIGWSRTWYIKGQERQWRWTNMLNWGHDNDERNGFSPTTRLEFIQELPHHQRLVAAAQYNRYFHQETTSDWQRRNNGYLFEVNYQVGW